MATSPRKPLKYDAPARVSYRTPNSTPSRPMFGTRDWLKGERQAYRVEVLNWPQGAQPADQEEFQHVQDAEPLPVND